MPQSASPLSYVDTIVIDRPPVNALSPDDWARFRDLASDSDADKVVRAVIISASGPTFCAGADIRTLTNRSEDDDRAAPLMSVADTCEAIRKHHAPVIAAIDGAALGGGLELALACDIRIATPRATFAAAGVNMGLIASVASLIGAIGDSRARRLLLTGERISADVALDWGLVTEMVSDGVETAAYELAATIAGNPPLAVEATKRAAREFHELSASEHRALTERLFAELARSADHTEALAAFMEKREGDYSRR